MMEYVEYVVKMILILLALYGANSAVDDYAAWTKRKRKKLARPPGI